MRYFCYDNNTGFDTFETEKEARDAAQNDIDHYRNNAEEGWSEDVYSVCWGEIKQETIKVNEKTTNEAAKEGIFVPDSCDGYCDYKLTDLSGESEQCG